MRVLILSCSTGEGHNAARQAMSEYLSEATSLRLYYHAKSRSGRNHNLYETKENSSAIYNCSCNRLYLYSILVNFKKGMVKQI